MVLLAAIPVGLAAPAVGHLEGVEERSGLYVGARVDFDDGEEALCFWLALPVGQVGLVCGGKVAFELSGRVPPKVLHKFGLADRGCFLFEVLSPALFQESAIWLINLSEFNELSFGLIV